MRLFYFFIVFLLIFSGVSSGAPMSSQDAEESLRELKENWDPYPAPAVPPRQKRIKRSVKTETPQEVVEPILKRKIPKSAIYDDAGLNPDEALQKLTQALEKIQADIQAGQHPQTPQWPLILKANRHFSKLHYQEAVWEVYAKGLQACRWPNQTSWKQVVGGHLFFPAQTFDWENAPFEVYRLSRNDSIWSFAVAAKQKHPFGAFFLEREVGNIIKQTIHLQYSDFTRGLLKEALQGLRDAEKTPEVCYVIGACYDDHSSRTAALLGEEEGRGAVWWIKKALSWHERGADLKNQLGILELKNNVKALDEVPPPAEDYLALARAGYLPAYSKAASRAKDKEQKKQIREEALEKGYTAIFSSMGASQVKKDVFKAREFFEKAGQAGVPDGYIRLGLTYLRENIESLLLQSETSEDVNHAIQAFTLAGEAGYPEGWTYLAKLLEKLHEKNLITEKYYQQKMTKTILRAVDLGFMSSISLSFSLPSQRFFDQIISPYKNKYLQDQLVSDDILSDFLKKVD